MRYRWFPGCNVIGAFLRVVSFTLAGFFFALPLVKQNFSLIIYAIIGISLLAILSIVFNVIGHPEARGKAPGEREKRGGKKMLPIMPAGRSLTGGSGD
jgi:membrane-associated protein